MKRLFLLSLLAFVAIGANAQSAFRCNANNVSVKNGPGSKYRRVLSWGEMPVILSKGDIVYFDGVRRNGYVKISDSSPRQPGWEGGWALAKFFVPMKKCSVCKGTGYLNKPCPHGDPIYGCMAACECHGTGSQICKKCDGIGSY